MSWKLTLIQGRCSGADAYFFVDRVSIVSAGLVKKLGLEKDIKGCDLVF